MNQTDKVTIKAQLQAVTSQITVAGNLATAGSNMPVITPMGPANAPGLLQIGAAISAQNAALNQLVNLINKIVDVS